MKLSIFIKSNYKLIIHLIVIILSICSIIITILSSVRVDNNLFQSGLPDTLLFIFTIYVLAFFIFPLLYKNWRKYLYITLSYVIFYSILLGWIRAVQRNYLVMIKTDVAPGTLEYFTFESVLRLSLTLIPLGIMAFIYNILVIDINVLKKAFKIKRFELIANSIIVSLIYFYVIIMLNEIETSIIATLSIFIVSFYVNVFYLAPLILKKKAYTKYILLSLLKFITVICLIIFILPGFNNIRLSLLLNISIINIIIIWTISILYAYVRGKTQEKDLIIEVKKSELNLLKSQVNPHFLFNTLNTLYSTALEENAPKTAESTAKLASLIRYMQEDINKDFIPLENEIKYLENYISIQKLRCSVEPDIETKFSHIENHQLSPGLLIPFVENAFKYGIDPSKKSKLSVSIICEKNTISFECINTYDENYKTYYKEQGFGIGIKNAKQRLELVYPKKHTIDIKKENNIFSVKINLNITNK